MPRQRSTQLPKPDLPAGVERDLQRAIAIVREVRQELTTQTERLDQLESELRLLVTGPEPLPFPLTAHQIAALRAVAEGKTTRQIATLLTIAPSSVDSLLNRTYHKLDVRNRHEAAFKAWTLGLI